MGHRLRLALVLATAWTHDIAAFSSRAAPPATARPSRAAAPVARHAMSDADADDDATKPRRRASKALRRLADDLEADGDDWLRQLEETDARMGQEAGTTRRSWLSRFSLLNRMASFFEETLDDWPDEPERRVAREMLRRTTVAVRTLESEWEFFAAEVQSDVDGLMLLDDERAAPAALVAVDANPRLRRARAQLLAALRVLQREGWRDLEEVLTDAVPPEYHALVRDVIARSRLEGEAPNATVLRKAIQIASLETQTNLRSRLAAAKRGITRRREQMRAATAEIKADVLQIEREIETAFNDLKLEWQRALAAGELPEGAERAGPAKTYSELREFVERGFMAARSTEADTGARPTLGELRARWRAAALLPAPARGARGADAAQQESRRQRQQQAGPLRVSAASDMRADGRHITIVTTASIPWMTGTSVNPLLRASYLAARDGDRRVTLVLPWLEPADQAAIFPADLRFEQPSEQEAYIRWWATEKGALPSLNFEIAWYPAAYARVAGSIMPTTDVVRQLPAHCTDIVVLEEPEHLAWGHHGLRWNRYFRHVVGVAHTNYLAYTQQYGAAVTAANFLLTSLTVAAYCDVVIKLSDTLQWLPGRCLVRNVHGVRPDFLAIGARRATLDGAAAHSKRGAYFLAKALWAKGYRELVDFTSDAAGGARALAGREIACFGSGPDGAAIRAEAEARGCALRFHGAIDHAHESLYGYHVFVNPSTSEVLCTATAEALAMGKLVVVPEHPSNAFFKAFQNCRFFRDEADFGATLAEALASTPEPLTAVERYTLSWEAAIERLMDAAALPDGSPRQADLAPYTAAYALHWTMGLPLWGDRFRGSANAIRWKPYQGYTLPSRSLAARSTVPAAAHAGQAASQAADALLDDANLADGDADDGGGMHPASVAATTR